MRESSQDLEQLQSLLDRSFKTAGRNLRSIFSEETRMLASEAISELDSVFEMHIGVLTGSGAPLVAPVDGILYRGRVCFGFPAQSVRAGLIRRDPRVSASYQNERAFAFIIHGNATTLEADDPFFEDYEELLISLYTGLYGDRWIEWYEKRDAKGEYNGFIEPRVMFVKRGS